MAIQILPQNTLWTRSISFIYFSHSLCRASKDEQIISSSQSPETTSSVLHLNRIAQLVHGRESRGGETAEMYRSLHLLHIHTEGSRNYKCPIHNLVNTRNSRKKTMRGQNSFSLISERMSYPFGWCQSCLAMELRSGIQHFLSKL